MTATWRESFSRALGPTVGGSGPPDLNHAWVISEYPSDKLGHHISLLLGPCARVAGPIRAINGKCLSEHTVVYTHAVFHPASRFWLFQGIETALFSGIAIFLTVFAAWWTHQRTS